MEREILFRGFCPNENGKQIITLDGEDIRGDWVYGDLIHNIDCVKVRERETDINRIAKSYIVIEETVGQYGDIVEVIFTEYGAFVGETESRFYESRGGMLTEVIGTIFGKEE